MLSAPRLNLVLRLGLELGLGSGLGSVNCEVRVRQLVVRVKGCVKEVLVCLRHKISGYQKLKLSERLCCLSVFYLFFFVSSLELSCVSVSLSLCVLFNCSSLK